MMDPTNPYTVGYYYTYDARTAASLSGRRPPAVATCNGAFGMDVRNADGLIVVSDMNTGFWAFKMDGFDGWNGHQWGMPNVSAPRRTGITARRERRRRRKSVSRVSRVGESAGSDSPDPSNLSNGSIVFLDNYCRKR